MKSVNISNDLELWDRLEVGHPGRNAKALLDAIDKSRARQTAEKNRLDILSHSRSNRSASVPPRAAPAFPSTEDGVSPNRKKKEKRDPTPAQASKANAAPASPSKKDNVKICSLFIAGQCQQGENCRFRHEAGSATPGQLLKAITKAKEAKGKGGGDGGKSRGRSQSQSRGEGKPQQQRGRTPGKSGRGRSKSRGQSNDGKQGGNRSSSKPQEKVDKICAYWGKGTCRNGNKCPFKHEGPSGGKGGAQKSQSSQSSGKKGDRSQSADKPVPVCYRFARGLECDASTCKFSHKKKDIDAYKARQAKKGSGKKNADS